MLKHVGIAGHLRAGFLAITAFVMLAAGAGVYAFLDISNALTEITERRVPSTLAAQRLSRRAEAIIDSAPKLVTAQSRARFEARRADIFADMRQLKDKLSTVGGPGVSVTDAPFEGIVADLDRNLKELTRTVSRELAVEQALRRQMAAWDTNYGALLNLLDPSLRVRRERLDELRAAVRGFQPNSEARRVANADLRSGLRAYLPLQDLRLVLARINDTLNDVADRTEPLDGDGVRRNLEQALEQARTFVSRLDTDSRALMEDRLGLLATVLDGGDSILARQAEKVRLKQQARSLLDKNETLSGQLDEAVNTLVGDARRQINEAVANAERTKVTGATVMTVVVLLSLVSVAVIMRYYVGRNVVRRLGDVRDSMLALSRGDLDHPLPVAGSDEIGRMTYALSVFRDNALRLRQRTRELQIARDEAVRSSDAKTRFLANMSHELRTPLNAVIGFSEIIQNEAVGPIGEPRYREYARDIHDSATHLLEVINDILDVAKAEAGKLELSEEVVRLTPFVAKTLRLVERRARHAEVTLRTDLPDQLPDLVADPLRLRQILLNLLSNGIKFTRPGGSVTVGATPRADGRLDLTVVDTGIGMSDGEVQTALAPFSQIDNTFSRHAEGTGLGLPLTKHLVELHDGDLHIASVKHAGTRITATFPASRVIRNEKMPAVAG